MKTPGQTKNKKDLPKRVSVHFTDWRQMFLLYRHTQEESQPVWVYFEKPASYLPVGIQRLLHGGFTFLFQKTQISLGFLFNILAYFFPLKVVTIYLLVS